MQPIPIPQVLDPDRILDNSRSDLVADHEARAQLLEAALHDTCDYAQQLWHDLDAMRGYLLHSLPPDPRTPSSHPVSSASPTGPDDDSGWDNWVTAYASVTSVLCGPRGDSGYGLGEARREATLRRAVPTLGVAAERADPGETPTPDDHAADEGISPKSRDGGRSRTARAGITTVLVLLAIRGLRPRRRPSW